MSSPLPHSPLPIDPQLPEICAALAEKNLVLVAPPGAGKTTRLPLALLKAQPNWNICVVVPRRIAASSAAKRVASEMGEAVGQTVGYEVRLENKVSAKTRLRFVTDGIFLRYLAGKTLPFHAVLLDEFHERRWAMDAALATLLVRQKSHTGLRIAVMSATIAAEKIAELVSPCAKIVTEGRQFPVEIQYVTPPASRGPARFDEPQMAMARAIREQWSKGSPGHILAFLPGTAEIFRVERELGKSGLPGLVLPLHGSLKLSEQEKVFVEDGRRKIILATNVAETSLTIPGVSCVIDSGMARIARHFPWSGISSLQVEAISQASCIQRAGRAGRTENGVCVRLFAEHDFRNRRTEDLPEIVRTDLCELALWLTAQPESDLPWLTPPPPESLEAAFSLLRRLGAIEKNNRVMTKLGETMSELPFHPRLARFILAANDLGVGQTACVIASLLNERPQPFERVYEDSESDIWDEFENLQHGGRFKDEGYRQRILRVAEMSQRKVRADLALSDHEKADRIGQALLVGFSDRVGKKRNPADTAVVFANGGSGELARESRVRRALWMVALEAEERGRGGDAEVSIRRVSSIDPLWLLDLGTGDLLEEETYRISESRQVERISKIRYGKLMIDESVVSDISRLDKTKVADVLLGYVKQKGPSLWQAEEVLAGLQQRIECVTAAWPETALGPWRSSDVDEAMRRLCENAKSIAEIVRWSLIDALWTVRGDQDRRKLDELAPESLQLQRRRVKVHYQADKPPWIESRLQDFFGMSQTPRIVSGRLPIVLHLLAPNGRAVQVTSDLASFWKTHYPSIRKELSRRYPRHSWPENPLLAEPPAKR